MKILFDHQIFTWQKYGGISRYFYEIMEQFTTDEEVDFCLSLNYSENEYLKLASTLNLKGVIFSNNFTPAPSKKTLFDSLPNFRGKGRLHSLIYKYKENSTVVNIAEINKKHTIDNLNENSFDIFHPTYYDPYFLDYVEKPYVITVYDMIHELFSKKFPEYDNGTKEDKEKTIVGARKIFAISESTKKDLINILGINKDKIEVVHLATSLKFVHKVPLELPQEYILFVGDRQAYKNWGFFVYSISKLLRKRKSLYLICAGGKSFTGEELFFIKNLNLSEKVLHYRFESDNTLANLYHNALLFVFPSIYEGFGIPILESFSNNCPVALSSASCFPEIAQESGSYFDPANEDSILDTIEILLDDHELRKKKIELGAKRLLDFSWKTTSDKTLKIYESLIRDLK